MTKDELYTRVDAELLCGASNREVAEKYDVGYQTVANRAKELNKTEVDGTLRDDNITKATLELVRDRIAVEAPRVAKQADAIIDGLEGLKVLNSDIQASLSKTVKIVDRLLDEYNTPTVDEDGVERLPDIPKRDLQVLASILTSVYTALNQKSTTVNVAQTTVTSQGENLAFFSANVRDV